jgi:hypothetical protein
VTYKETGKRGEGGGTGEWKEYFKKERYINKSKRKIKRDEGGKKM